MVKLALIGYPLSHSISAIIHKAALKNLGIDGEYELIETSPEDIFDQVKYLKAYKYDGFNVTIPHKIAITIFIDKFDDNANLAGCVNTVKILPDYTMMGYNTDIYGFVKAIPQATQAKLKNSKVAILGTGGAARASAIGLFQLGVKEIDFYSRNILNAKDMIDFLRDKFPDKTLNIKQIESMKDLSDIEMLVNSTPIGMKSVAANESPVFDVYLETMKKDAVVYDIVYNPLKTVLLKQAENLGINTISGLDMLIYQAARAFEIWTGKTPDTNVMKIAALEYFTNENII